MAPKKNGQNGIGLARLMADSAHQIWLTGLSAVALVDREGHKSFGKLTKVPGHAADFAGGLLDRMRDNLKLRTNRLLNSLQIPTARDVQELSRRVDALNKTVQTLSGEPRKATRSKTATRKKTTATKKTAAGAARPGKKAERKRPGGNGSAASVQGNR